MQVDVSFTKIQQACQSFNLFAKTSQDFIKLQQVTLTSFDDFNEGITQGGRQIQFSNLDASYQLQVLTSYFAIQNRALYLEQKRLEELTDTEGYWILSQCLMNQAVEEVALENDRYISKAQLQAILNHPIKPALSKLIQTLKVIEDLEIHLNEKLPPLFHAVIMQRADACQEILKKSLPTVTDEIGRTPLQFASYLGDLETVRLLYRAGAEVKQETENCDSALFQVFYAAVPEEQKLEILTLLLEDKTLLAEKNRNGLTLLMSAAYRGCTLIASYLLSLGVDVNETNEYKDTALIMAIQEGKLETAAFLINQGADVYQIYEEDLYTPLALLKLFPKQQLKALEQLKFNKQDPDYKIAKEFLRRKILANVFALSLQTRLQDVETAYSLEGLPFNGQQYLIKKMLKYTAQLESNSTFENFPFKAFSEFLQTGYLTDPYALFEKWKSGLPILILGGFIGHRLNVVLHKNTLIICNRGAGSRQRQSFEIFNFNKQRLMAKQINQLREYFANKEAYLSFLDQFEKDLKLEKTELTLALEKSISMPLQDTGNCGFANLEAACLSFMVIHSFFKEEVVGSSIALEQIATLQKENFQQWIKGFQAATLIHYLKKKLKEKKSEKLARIDYILLSLSRLQLYDHPRFQETTRLMQELQS